MKIEFRHFKKNTGMIGLCDYPKRTIYIDKNLKLISKMITVCHELIHYIIHILGGRTEHQFVFDILSTIFDRRYKNKKRTIKWLISYYYY